MSQNPQFSRMAPKAFFLKPCTSKSPKIEEEDDEGDPIIAANSRANHKGAIFAKRKRGIVVSKIKRGHKNAASSSTAAASSSSSSCATAASSTASQRRNRGKQRGPRKDDEGLQDLALPLGMSFAAIVSQVLDGINRSGDQIPVDRLSLICTLAMKESVVNIYGKRFDCFLLNFEKSFGSTLRTLRLINEASVAGHRNKLSHVSIDEQGYRTANEPSIINQRNVDSSSFSRCTTCEDAQDSRESRSASIEKFEDFPVLTTMSNQIVVHGQTNQVLASASHSFSSRGHNQSILSTFEKSVMEQTRSNDLKAFEIGLIRRKLQLKESKLALSSYKNMLERIKISMGISKASFKEEKLRNQMLDTRHAEFLRRCIDLLVAGLIVMSGCLSYGTYVYSFQRITEATSACSATPKESSSWWVPKPVASFNSGWLMLRCHVVALTRMFSGLAMILAVTYLFFQRSSLSTPTTMPVTFILLLGFLCGIAGKLCVDTLGGSGFYWLLYWESLCLIHFFANIFPSVLYQLLYGRISTSQFKVEGRFIPYWLRRFMFNIILAIVYPAFSGLLPFASLGDWSGHFAQKASRLIIGVEN